MRFEKASLDDIGTLTELRAAYLLDDHGEIPEEELGVLRLRLLDYFRAHLGRDMTAFVAREGGEIAACCLLLTVEKPPSPSFPRGRVGVVFNVYTRPEYRRQGAARRLMELLLDDAEEQQLDHVELKATDAGYHLYRSLGFEDTASEYHEMKFFF